MPRREPPHTPRLFRQLAVSVAAAGLAALGFVQTWPSSAHAQAVQERSASIQGQVNRFADSAGVKIHYHVEGEGPLVILIHGFPEPSTVWTELASTLSDSYRVVALDLRGFGRSEKPSDQSAYAIPILLRDIEAVIAAEKRSSATLIGHDIGAAIAWRMALAKPDKVDALVTLAMPHPAAYAQDLAANPKQRAAYAYFQQLKDSANEPTTHFFRANDLSTLHTKDEQELTINLPILVIHGEQDDIVLPSGNDGTWDYVSSDSAVLRVPRAGHFLLEDAPDVLVTTIRSWLDLHRR